MTLACSHAQEITGADGAAIIVPDGLDMVLKTTTGGRSDQIGLRVPAQESLASLCIESGEAVICGDVQSDVRVKSEAIRALGIRSLLIVPLSSEGETLGVLCVCSSKPNSFNAGDLHALSLISEFYANTFARLGEAAEKQTLLDMRTEALERVQENDYLMRSTFDAIQEGLTLMSAEGTVELCNPAALRILDVAEQDLIGLRGPLPGCQWLSKDGIEFPQAEFPESRRTGNRHASARCRNGYQA